ncbi:hypothetical protein NFI96_009196, partial [Prochilodus magdalenae]
MYIILDKDNLRKRNLMACGPNNCASTVSGSAGFSKPRFPSPKSEPKSYSTSKNTCSAGYDEDDYTNLADLNLEPDSVKEGAMKRENSERKSKNDTIQQLTEKTDALTKMVELMRLSAQQTEQGDGHRALGCVKRVKQQGNGSRPQWRDTMIGLQQSHKHDARGEPSTEVAELIEGEEELGVYAISGDLILFNGWVVIAVNLPGNEDPSLSINSDPQLALGSWLLALGSWLLALGSWLLALGSWLLALGSWLLALGSWLLALGSWLLALIPYRLPLYKGAAMVYVWFISKEEDDFKDLTCTSLFHGVKSSAVTARLHVTQREISSLFMKMGCHIVKFVDDTAVVGCITNSDESGYRQEIEHLEGWCRKNNLCINVKKPKEMIVDFRRGRHAHLPLHVGGSAVEVVFNYRYLGVHQSNNLTWSNNTSSLVRKAHQRLYFLRRWRRAGLGSSVLTSFYRCVVESVVCSSINVWHGSCSAADRKALQRVVKAAQRSVGVSLPTTTDIYTSRCRKRATCIMKDPTHPVHSLFVPLPSGRRLRSIKCKTNRLRNSFTPEAGLTVVGSTAAIPDSDTGYADALYDASVAVGEVGRSNFLSPSQEEKALIG